MRKAFALALPLLALSLGGCIVQSLQPLYRTQDLVFQPELVGKWQEQQGSDRWEFKKSGDLAYEIVLTESDGDSGTFEGHVLKLGGTVFLDLLPDDHSDARMAATYSFHLLPVHSFLRVDRLSPTPTFTPLDADWMNELLKKTPGVLRHETMNTGSDPWFVLTASTDELQTFVKAHATDAAAFKKPIVLEALR